jgi:zinc-ribbon domain
MSIIACPECGKNISSRAVICSHCGVELGEVTEQDLAVFRARRLRDRIYHLNMISYAVITLFLGGFGWYWWDSSGFTQPPTAGPFVLMGLAGAAYIVVRALLFRNRQLRKAMRHKPGLGSDLRRNL